MRIWTVANQKGGVGKTTTAVTLAGLLADRGARALLIDLDPHGSMTGYFKLDAETLPNSCFNLFGDGDLSLPQLQALIHEIDGDRIHLMPSSPALATIERKALGQDGMGLRVSRALAQLWDQYDYALIDTPPVLGALMINALAAAERLLIPVQTEFLALKGLERMLRTLTMVTRSLHKELPYFVIPTMFDRRTHASVSSLRTLRNDYEAHAWRSMIPVDTRFRDASRAGVVPSHYDADARGVKAYASLLKVLLASQEQRLRA